MKGCETYARFLVGLTATLRILVAFFAGAFLPAIFFRRLRAESVLPVTRVAFLRGAARAAFFFCVSTFRAERAPGAFGAGMKSVLRQPLMLRRC